MSFAEQSFNTYGLIPQAPKAPGLDKNLSGYISNDRVGGKTFGGTLASLIQKANDTMAQPERLSIEAVKTGKVDIHEVMIALGKSEVAFKLITAITQKTVGAFDKLSSMQV